MNTNNLTDNHKAIRDLYKNNADGGALGKINDFRREQERLAVAFNQQQQYYPEMEYDDDWE